MSDINLREFLNIIRFIAMAQVKLFIPGLTSTTCLFQFMGPHSALLSLAYPEDQAQEPPETNKERFQTRLPKALAWRMMGSRANSGVLKRREEMRSLRFAMDEDNDYESSL